MPVRLQREPLRAGLQPDLRVRERGAVRATQRPLQLPARLDRSVLPGRCSNRFHTRPRLAAETFPADSGETGVNKAAQVLTVRKCEWLVRAGGAALSPPHRLFVSRQTVTNADRTHGSPCLFRCPSASGRQQQDRLAAGELLIAAAAAATRPWRRWDAL